MALGMALPVVGSNTKPRLIKFLSGSGWLEHLSKISGHDIYRERKNTKIKEERYNAMHCRHPTN